MGKDDPGIMDILRAIKDPRLLAAIEKLKENAGLLEDFDPQKLIADIERHSKMLELTYKHLTVVYKYLEAKDPEAFKAARDEVNKAWAKAQHGE